MKSLIALLLLSIGCFAQSNKPVFNEDQSQMLMNGKVYLDSNKDGFMGLKKVLYAPNGKQFLVLACGFECSDNIGFLFNANGTGKRKFNQAWDWIFNEGVEWSADSKFVYYYRINSTAADPPLRAPKEGWVQVNAKTGAKAAATARRLKGDASYAVFRIADTDPLNIRSAPGSKNKVLGTIPSGGKGIRFLGATKQSGPEVWAKIEFGKISGWVNQSYLYEEGK
jgi:hypothetical protein